MFVLAAIALPGLSSAAFAAERVVRVKVTADSPQEGVEAFRAMDGDPKTIWHTCWRPNRTPQPHEIVVDLGKPYEITGFTYLPAHRCIKDYEVYLSDSPKESAPLAEGTPIAKGAFTDAKGESVVKFDAPVKGRYFRLRSLSAMGGQYMGAAAELRIHCEGVKFTAKPLSMAESFPEAGKEAIALIEGFPLLARLIAMKAPWSWDPVELKGQLLPEGTEPFPGSGDPPAMFVNRRIIQDWTGMAWGMGKIADSPGLRVWNYDAYETNYYAVPSASPFIRLHMGRPQLKHIERMRSLYPALPQSAGKEIRAKMDKIAEGLKAYGAKKLPPGHRNQPYLLPGGTKMTICDYTIRPGPTGRRDNEVRVKIDFEPATPIKGREMLPMFVRWRTAERKRDGAPSLLGLLAPSEAGDPAPATGEEAARKWSDRPDGFASVNAMGVNGTTGGAGGKVVTVTNQADLEKYAQAEEPYIVRVKGEIKVTEKKNPKTRYEKLTTKEIHIASNKTIVGVGKSGHIVNGGFFIGPGTHNVILRNLTIRDTYVHGDAGGLRNDFDGLQMDAAHHVWVDHCHFSRHGDGCLDTRAGTTYLTVSWCVFSDHFKTFGCGWDIKTTAQITLHHTWFRNTGCRAPAAGQVLRAHFYNNRYQNVGSYGHLMNWGTNMISQNCLFERVNRPYWHQDGTCTLSAVGNIFRATHAGNHLHGRTFFDPNRFYAFPLDKAKDLPDLLKKYAGPQENIGVDRPRKTSTSAVRP